MYEVTVHGEFSAAHYLKLYDGSWEPRHGHLFKVAVTVMAKKLDTMQVVVDFEWLKPALKKVLAEFHEKSFNDHPEVASGTLNPSTENMAKMIFDRLKKSMPKTEAVVSKVTVWETPDASAGYYEE